MSFYGEISFVPLKGKGVTFTDTVSKEIEVFRSYLKNSNSKQLKIVYYAGRQDAATCVVLSLCIEEAIVRDYRIRFMDKEGDILDGNIEEELDKIIKDIIEYYPCTKNPHELITGFYNEMEEIIIPTAFRRKKELLDFFDPEVWKRSEVKAAPGEVHRTVRENFEKLRQFRIEEENNLMHDNYMKSLGFKSAEPTTKIYD